MDEDKITVKLYECWPDGKTRFLYGLPPNNRKEHNKLLKRLELFADFLPYLEKAEDEFDYKIKLENLKVAIGLT